MGQSFSEVKEKLAVVILAYSDYESLELALASHAKFTVKEGNDGDDGVHIYVLQNGRGTYDCERTYSVAKRYHQLFPRTFSVVDDIEPGIPYFSLRTLFNSKEFQQYDYIVKLDDDVLVLTEDWLEKLWDCFSKSKEEYGKDLAYVTSLVNNNPYGFKKIIEYNEDLAGEYFTNISREHFVGCSPYDAYAPYRLVPKNKVVSGSNGTIWGYPYIARWLHEKTTFVPDEYVKFAQTLSWEEVNNKERYSINCMLFEKNLWEDINDGGRDDEHMCHAYCLKYNKRIIANLSVPMVHLFFFSQRAECKDMIDSLRSIYTRYLNLGFPITICDNREIEIENRLRFIENRVRIIEDSQRAAGTVQVPAVRQDLPWLSRKIIGGLICLHDNGLIYTVKRLFAKIFRR